MAVPTAEPDDFHEATDLLNDINLPSEDMSEHSAESARITNVARRALLLMGQKGLSPTPENFSEYYYKVAGDPPSDSIVKSLQQKAKAKETDKLDEWAKAIDLVMVQRDWMALEQLILESLHGANKSECTEKTYLQHVLYVMESFSKNLFTLFPDSEILKTQVEIVTELFEAPFEKAKLYSAKKALIRMEPPEETVAKIAETRVMAENLSTHFLDNMQKAGHQSAAFSEKLSTYVQKIEKAESTDEIKQVSKDLLHHTKQEEQNVKARAEQMLKVHEQVQDAHAKISVLEENLLEVANQVKQDYLTGTLTRSALDEEIQRVFEEPWEKITMALLDIDNFNKIIDELGHEHGDIALKKLADSIREIVGSRGIIGRLGCEGFVILFAGYDAEYVSHEMQAIQRHLTKDFYLGGIEGKEKQLITFSAGVAQKLEDETPDDVLARADEAMFKAKRLGRNKVEIAY